MLILGTIKLILGILGTIKLMLGILGTIKLMLGIEILGMQMANDASALSGDKSIQGPGICGIVNPMGGANVGIANGGISGTVKVSI